MCVIIYVTLVCVVLCNQKRGAWKGWDKRRVDREGLGERARNGGEGREGMGLKNGVIGLKDRRRTRER